MPKKLVEDAFKIQEEIGEGIGKVIGEGTHRCALTWAV